MGHISRRRFLEIGAQASAAAALAMPILAEAAKAPKSSAANVEIERFIHRHMQEWNLPGLTLALADANGTLLASGFGFSDTKLRERVTPQHLFQIGSITKSFVAIACLQLREEGKLDFEKPVTDYLKWLKVDTKYKPFTTHNLLSHTAGIPSVAVGNTAVSTAEGAMRLWTAYAPGEHFHYSNLGFRLLGDMIEQIDGRDFGESIRKRIFEPLGMTASDAIIGPSNRGRMAMSYQPFMDDRPLPRQGRLNEAPWIIFDKASGCIASTPDDMAKYMTMFLNDGKAGNRRVLSDEAFKLMTTGYILAPSFGDEGQYGYGIAITKANGHKVLRHTGGMVSFSSAMHVDVDGGVGAFASVNASLQGYRPNAVAGYAIRTLFAENEHQPIPAAPEGDDPYKVSNANEYLGTFTAADGRKLTFMAKRDGLVLAYKDREIRGERRPGHDNFLFVHPDLNRFPMSFSRNKEKVVTEVSHGPDWYANEHYSGPREFAYPKEWDQYTGAYKNDDVWEGITRIWVRKGKLWADGGELEPLDDGSFRSGGENSPERVRFDAIVNGKASRVTFSGTEYLRTRAW